MEAMDLYILVPVHNRRKITVKFAELLAAQTAQNFTLLLIDDGSSDGTSDAVLNVLPKSKIIRGNGSWWWAGSLQQGFDWLKRHKVSPDANILIINDDVTFDANFLEGGLRLLAHSKENIYLASCHDEDTKEHLDSGVHIIWPSLHVFPVTKKRSRKFPVNCLSTRGLFLKYATAKKIGGFYPRLLPHYYSDYEYTIRAKRKGIGLVSPSELKIYTSAAPSGSYDLSQATMRQYLKKIFSARSYSNPLYRSSFVLFAAPWGKKFGSLKTVWREFIRETINFVPNRYRKILRFSFGFRIVFHINPANHFDAFRKMHLFEFAIRMGLLPFRKLGFNRICFQVWDYYELLQAKLLLNERSSRFIARGFAFELLDKMASVSSMNGAYLSRAKYFFDESFAEEGEDILLDRFLNKPIGFYVDVGAYHPNHLSNTARFYRRGWTGINIDASQLAYEHLKSERPKDINVLTCIGRRERDMVLFEYENPVFNTCSRERVLFLEAHMGIRPLKVTSGISSRRLSDVLEQCLPSGQKIDFLSIDTKGFDQVVLLTNDWKKYRPQYMVVDDWEFPRSTELAKLKVVRFLRQKNYILICKSENTLFFKDNVKDNVKESVKERSTTVDASPNVGVKRIGEKSVLSEREFCEDKLSLTSSQQQFSADC